MSSRTVIRKKKISLSKSKRADVLFPVARLHRYLKNKSKKQRIGVGAAVYTASVLEYLVAEVMELAGNNAKECKNARITPRHILIATSLDQELHELMKGVTIPSSGVIPHINPALLKILPQKKKATIGIINPAIAIAKPNVKMTAKNRIGSTIPLKLRMKGKTISKGANEFNILSEKKLFLGQKLVVVQSDITKVVTEAIVHPTNSSLALYGHVGQALERQGGQKLRDEVAKVHQSGDLAPCNAVITPAFNTDASWIIHVNGPNHGDVNAYSKLETAVKNCLSIADSQNLKSIALPSIGSGKAGFPKQQAAQTILKAISNYFSTVMTSAIKIIYFVLYDLESIGIYTSEIAKLDG